MLYTCIGGFSLSSSRYYFHLIRSELDGFIKEDAIRVIARCALSQFRLIGYPPCLIDGWRCVRIFLFHCLSIRQVGA